MTGRRSASSGSSAMTAEVGPAVSNGSQRIATRSLRLSGALASRIVREALTAGGEVWVKGSGQSMYPTIRNADYVLLSPIRSAVRRGDIVLVPLGPGLMLHRVVDLTGKGVITRGDARTTNDVATSMDRIIARAIAVRRGDRVRALVPTLRFGFAPLLHFALEGTRRRARAVKQRLPRFRRRPGGR